LGPCALHLFTITGCDLVVDQSVLHLVHGGVQFEGAPPPLATHVVSDSWWAMSVFHSKKKPSRRSHADRQQPNPGNLWEKCLNLRVWGGYDHFRFAFISGPFNRSLDLAAVLNNLAESCSNPIPVDATACPCCRLIFYATIWGRPCVFFHRMGWTSCLTAHFLPRR
jgi:hypothetical protein